MQGIAEIIKDLIHKASEIHQRERQLTLESVELCGRLYHFRVHLNAGMTMDDFARRIGLTPDVYAKRAKAAGLMSRFPRIRQMVASGEIGIMSVAVLYPKITAANETALLDAVANKPKREVERLAARITHGGEWIEGEAEVELKLVLKESDLEKINRAREVLSHGGKVLVTAEILMKAVEELLERRDPVRKAERAAARTAAAQTESEQLGETRTSARSEANGFGVSVAEGYEAVACCGKEEHRFRPGAKDSEEVTASRIKRPAVPAAVRHQVMLRDRGQCTWVHAEGVRCPERLMLEMDHLVLWRRGGSHSAENLVLRCRAHNQYRAEVEMGRPLWDAG